MKVKEYLVSEILELKHNIRKLQEDIAKKDQMITAQRSRIDCFEKREEQYKENGNILYGKLCDVREIIYNNLFYEEPSKQPIGVSVRNQWEKEDFKKLMQILNIPTEEETAEEQEVPDEVPED